jgi:outer membrane protein
MKKTTIFLTASLCLALSCTSKKEAKVPENTKPSVPVVRTNGLKIAFYNQDSLKEGFIYFKNMDEMVKRKQIAFQNQLGTKEKELQNFVATNEERVKLGQLSAFEIQSIQQEAQKKEQTLYQLQQTQGAKLEK